MYSKHIIEALATQGKTLAELNASLAIELSAARSSTLMREVEISALVPPGNLGDLPLYIHLDGGVGDRMSLVIRRLLLASMIETKVIPPSVHISFSGGANEFYTDAWEQWVTDELPRWAHEQLGANANADKLLLTGMSAGGYGALKIAFKFPHRFKAVAAMEPVMMPTLDWPQQHVRASWWMLQASAEAIWGEPFPETFMENHPPNIVNSNAESIRDAGLDIYLEVGDEDLLNLQDGAEFLHRLLWKHDIPHEYHQVRWADHGGQSVEDRLIEALAFLAASHGGGKKEPRDLPLRESEKIFVDYVLGGGPLRGEAPPAGASGGSVESELTVMAKLWEPLKHLAKSHDPEMQRQYGRLPDANH